MKTINSIWRVTGCLEAEDGPEKIFDAYFSNRTMAHEVRCKGEREYGRMYWTLERLYLDNDSHVDQMFEDVNKEYEELTNWGAK